MKSFKNYINEGILLGGGAADKRTISYPKLMREWCNKYAKGSDIKVTIKGSKVICIGDIFITDKDIVELDFPFKIDVLDGRFNCTNCRNLKSLEGSPRIVTGDFICIDCHNIESLKGSPEKAKTFAFFFTLDSRRSKLTSLEGGPLNCVSYTCSGTNIKNLKGAPKRVDGNFYCYRCKKLESLEGAPKTVNGNFECDECDSLLSINGAPEYVGGNFSCCGCPVLTSLEGAPKTVKGSFNCSYCRRDFSKEDVRSICKVSGRVVV